MYVVYKIGIWGDFVILMWKGREFVIEIYKMKSYFLRGKFGRFMFII